MIDTQPTRGSQPAPIQNDGDARSEECCGDACPDDCCGDDCCADDCCENWTEGDAEAFVTCCECMCMIFAICLEVAAKNDED